jgi:hypothetical protein
MKETASLNDLNLQNLKQITAKFELDNVFETDALRVISKKKIFAQKYFY